MQNANFLNACELLICRQSTENYADFFSYIKIYKLHSTIVYVSAAARDTSPEIPDITILQTLCTKSSLSGLDPVQSLLYGVYLYCHDITETPAFATKHDNVRVHNCMFLF